ncbi:MAG: prepilin-type N-terminal cleavage/methylation domain-containing protein [Desulfobacteraceae bacterium]|jgi:type IV fimbrial biogenesis protein FimT|nr:MAG: prepilin-type N-terminal cleavage/methylation domain-containing protein [Desulfobacteraceae bacterium]
MDKKNQKCRLGFTIVEMAVAMLIIVIIAATVTPVILRWLPNYRLRTAARDLFSNMQLAKMNAVKSNSNVAVVFNQPIGGTTFDYVVFADANNNLEYDAGEIVIARTLLANYRGVEFDTAQGGGDGLTFTANDDGLPAIAFRGNGLTRSNAGGFGAGTAFFINTDGRTISVVVSAAGAIRIN